MTDKEIVKALECCAWCPPSCRECPYTLKECSSLRNHALSLINRQKAEIERLEAENEEQHQAIINALHRMGKIRAEAAEEFAERLKKELSFGRYTDEERIDNLVKEFTEGGDGNQSMQEKLP